MKLTGNIFTTFTEHTGPKSGISTSTQKPYSLLRVSMSIGQQVVVRDDAGNIVMENGQPKKTWANTYYNLTLFGALGKKLEGMLEEARKKGDKVLQLEVSGELDLNRLVYTDRNGAVKPANNVRVISMRIPGQTLWDTTSNGALIQRQIN